ncbi:Pentatricopeptide repeat-containing protein [Heracleum sosnowskyi]|uniref:Pentatricopeptide repeat-containing protein n=1 Tax=Heracleum sosnowskyi TaxID=360622 RepID=A0AAD8IMG2_9APIA|nr:Pentatricopeptide repeat-containing protein [Heracleum sosnowskyi]
MNVMWPRLLTPTHLSQLIRKQKSPVKALQIFNEAKSKYPNYRHNGPVYATMISILGSSGRIVDMKKVIDQMKADSCECKDSVFATAINTYAKAGLLDEAVTLFQNLPKFNCVNWTESFNTLLGIMINESKLETAYRLFLERSFGWEVKSRTHSLTLLINAMCQSGRSDLALHVFLEFNSQCCYPGKETYRILMRGLCADGRLDDATHLLYSMFWRISQKGSGKILRKGLKAPKRCLKQLDLARFHNCDDKVAKNLIDEALIKGGIPSSDSYNVMAVDLYSEGNISTANKVIHEMHDRGFKPTLLIYEAKVEALCRHDSVDEAIEVIEKEMADDNCIPSIKLYNTVMKGLCDEGRSIMAIGYLKKIFRQVGCVPNKDTYSILVDGLCAEAKYIEAGQILEEMLKSSYSPSENTYNSLIQGLCSMERPFEAIMLLEEMVSQAKMPDISVWKSLVASVCAETHTTKVVSAMLEPISKAV